MSAWEFRDFSHEATATSASNRTMASASTKNIAIVGGGPVGALAALYFAKHFEKVIVYELRAGLAPFLLNGC